MASSGGWFAVLLVLVAANLWVHLGPRTTHVAGGVLTTVALLVIGLASGLGVSGLGLAPGSFLRGAGYGCAAAAVVAVGYGAALALPRAHQLFRDRRYRLGRAAALRTALVVVPLATVVPEEVAFRGVLWGLVDRESGPVAAAVVTSVLFGLWHVLPALQLMRTSTALRDESSGGRLRRIVVVLAVVAFTTVAGLVLAELRRRSGSLVAPTMLHLATNSLGVLASAWVWSFTGRTAPPGTPRGRAPRLRRRRADRPWPRGRRPR